MMTSRYRSSSDIRTPKVVRREGYRVRRTRSPPEDPCGDVEAGGCVVDIEAGSGGGRNPELSDQWLGAMVAGAHRHALHVEDGGEVVGVGVAEGEAHNTATLGQIRRPIHD